MSCLSGAANSPLSPLGRARDPDGIAVRGKRLCRVERELPPRPSRRGEEQRDADPFATMLDPWAINGHSLAGWRLPAGFESRGEKGGLDAQSPMPAWRGRPAGRLPLGAARKRQPGRGARRSQGRDAARDDLHAGRRVEGLPADCHVHRLPAVLSLPLLHLSAHLRRRDLRLGRCLRVGALPQSAAARREDHRGPLANHSSESASLTSSPLWGEGFPPRSCASEALRKSHGGKGEGVTARDRRVISPSPAHEAASGFGASSPRWGEDERSATGGAVTQQRVSWSSARRRRRPSRRPRPSARRTDRPRASTTARWS
jgi:hypothetical protein